MKESTFLLSPFFILTVPTILLLDWALIMWTVLMISMYAKRLELEKSLSIKSKYLLRLLSQMFVSQIAL